MSERLMTRREFVEELRRDYQAKGFRLMAYSTDVMLLRSALAEGIAALRAGDRQ